jgi:hypothetical protein
VLPQALQSSVREAPQPLQNFAPASFSCPQFSHGAMT